MTAPRWAPLLAALADGTDLAESQTAWAMDEVMAGNASDAQLAAFAVLLRAKGETPAELAGLVRTMRARATPLSVPGPAVDIVGTGADRANTVNISTMAALVVAGSGRRVVKHGNRAASSACGAADVLEELGVRIDAAPAQVARDVERVGIGFCFAPTFHAGMRFSSGPRREIGIPTVFNFLGPLSNPARVPYSAVGCADLRMAPIVAQVFADRGDRALVFRGDDGLDELTTTTTSQVWVAVDGGVRRTVIDPAALGIEPVLPEALRGGDRVYNAAAVRDLLAGVRGGVRDVVLLNAAAAIAVYDGVSAASLPEAMRAGLAAAAEAVDSGAAARVLQRWTDADARTAGAPGTAGGGD